MTLPSFKKTSLFWIFIGALVVSSVLFRTAIARQFISQPELFSELYFTNFAELPKSATQNDMQNVAFTVKNHEQKQTTYRLKILFTTDNGTNQVTKATSFTLKASQTGTFRYPVKIPYLGPHEALQVQIAPMHNPGKVQSIRYWLTVKNEE